MSNSTQHITVRARRRGRLTLLVSACTLLLLSAAFLVMPLTVSADHGGGNGGNGGSAQNDNHGRDGNGNQMDKNDDHGKDVVDRDNDRNRGNDVDNNDNNGNGAVDNDVNDDRGNDAVDNDAVMIIPPVAGMVTVPHEPDNDR